jgi:DNA anti-recombination protein RmuC
MDKKHSLYKILGDTYRITAEAAAKAAMENHTLYYDMLDAALGDDKTLSMRASRVIQICCERDSQLAAVSYDAIIASLPGLRHDSQKRNMLKCILQQQLTKKEEQLSILLDSCLQWLNNNNESIAVRAFSADIIYEISGIIPEIKGELLASLQNMQCDNSPGLLNKQKRMSKKLQKEITSPKKR